MKNQQILVAADDRVGTRGQRKFEILVVFRIAAIRNTHRCLEPERRGSQEFQELPEAPRRDGARASFGLLNTSGSSASAADESAKTSTSSTRSKARSGTLSALSTALTMVEASKTINGRGRVAPRCEPPPRRRFRHRSSRLAGLQPSDPQSPEQGDQAQRVDAGRG